MPNPSSQTHGEFYKTVHCQYETTHHCSYAASSVSFPVNALFNSGSAGNFISGALCRQLNLSDTTIKTIYQVQSVTGKPLSRRHVRHSVGPPQLQVVLLHEETLHFLVLEDSTADVILGHPWLVQHNLVLSWKYGEILKWGEKCFPDCFRQTPHPPARDSKSLPVCFTSFESPVEKQSFDIPSCYAPFSNIFCSKRTSKLHPH